MAIAQRRMKVEEFLALPEEEPALELRPDGMALKPASADVRSSM